MKIHENKIITIGGISFFAIIIVIYLGFNNTPTADSRFAVPCPTGQERSPKSAPTTCTNR